METSGKDSADESSIKPVSSLLSHFENLGARKGKSDKVAGARDSTRLAPTLTAAPNETEDRSFERRSFDIPRHGTPVDNSNSFSCGGNTGGLHTPGHTLPRARSSFARSRPVSMGPWSPAHSQSPPRLMVDAPQSPPRNTFNDSSSQGDSNRRVPANGLSIPPRLPPQRSKTLSRPGTPVRDSESSKVAPRPSIEVARPSMDATRHGMDSPRPSMDITRSGMDASRPSMDTFRPSIDTSRPSLDGRGGPVSRFRLNHKNIQKRISTPPPVNRADKPKIPAKNTATTNGLDRLTLTPKTQPIEDNKVSPFSTPPGSDGCPSPERSSPIVQNRWIGSTRNLRDSPPLIQPSKGAGNSQGRISPSRLSSRPMDARDFDFPGSTQGIENVGLDRPGLPSRRESMDYRRVTPKISSSSIKQNGHSPLPPQGQAEPMKASNPMVSVVADADARFQPPPKRHSFAQPSRSMPKQAPNSTQPSLRPDNKSNNVAPPPPKRTSHAGLSQDTPINTSMPIGVSGRGEYPDSSQTNRRPPYFRAGSRNIQTMYDTRLFDICGQYACTTGFITKVWNILTGEVLLNFNHPEMTKMTSLGFKPAAKPDDEGKRLWLGSNGGELLEVDIISGGVVDTKTSVHAHKDIVKIFRHKKEMWSLDEDGGLLVWPSDETGVPDLQYSPLRFRIPKNPSFSLLVGDQLWVAYGKDIRIFFPGSKSTVGFQVLERPLIQPNVGEVTSGTVFGRDHSRVYFGHTDGKVTIYNTSDYACLGIVNISAYKINSLADVGDYLWAAFNTGMIYVYDINQSPWKVKKDWQAHTGPVAGLVADHGSVWRLNRLQVASLGGDNTVRLWDGLLEDDWLETEMQAHDVDYCSFRELSALVVTWNAGASTPSDLQHGEKDINFFEDIFQDREAPDILIFGFQELVDLEDKKMTAKSLFKNAKKRDASEKEHMSRQYRRWRDYLTRALENCMPSSESYSILHTANLVGLFYCIFVKASERQNVHYINATEIKRGLGGMHGNKGALMFRFCIDDTSVCLVNCHLAAGQTQTVHRNNDIAAILEADAFPVERDLGVRIDRLVGGGDGTMVMDHEICILNGDLNYRIDTMSRDTVIRAVKERNLEKLLERDQLLLSKKRNPAFRLRAFNEARITFAPTYKYDVGTDNYDSSEKRRSPAWCDRILYRGVGRVKQIDYRRHESVRVSDHRPVSGAFKMRIKRISPKHRIVAWDDCERRLLEMKKRMAVEAR
ncbi:MAG: hypothetical protein M1834_005076 [Cirrosporium novae-zelandiae]|nr:MAG: hypothetical protein M1834_005076 [Cirrosporium novae-zelandiae]